MSTMTESVSTTPEDLTIIKNVRVVSSTKDSVQIGWIIKEEYLSNVNFFKIQYQAEGSSIVKFTPRLEPEKKNYDIQNLHENTYYKMCVRAYTSLQLNSTVPCVRATTSVDSLHVALGSTFGAFLALGIIVMFVFIAKWQNSRKLKKQLRNISPTNDKYHSMPPNDGDIEMSDVSLNVNDTQSSKAHDANSYSSQVSGYHSYTNQSRKSLPICDCNPDASDQSKSPRKGSQSHSSHSGSPKPPTISPPPEPSDSSKIRKQKSTDSQHSHHSPERTTPVPTVSVPPETDVTTDDAPKADVPASQNMKKDYGGARPKEFSPNDPRNLYANQVYMEIPSDTSGGLRPNLSCKW